MKVDSTTTELISVQSSLTELIGLSAKVEKLEDTIAHLLSKNTHLEAENMLLKQKMSSLERRQTQNNIILSGLLEEPWEDLKKMKLKVTEKISHAFPDYSKEEANKKQIPLLCLTANKLVNTKLTKQDG